MIATLKKRPLWGLDQYVHYFVLCLSVFNLIKTLVTTMRSPSFFIISVLLSILGVVSFFLVYKKHRFGNLLIFIWAIPQLIIWSKTSTQTSEVFIYDVVQGTSLPINFTSETSSETIILSLNILAVAFLVLALFKLRNGIYQSTIYLTSINLKKPIQLTAQIKKIYTLDNKNRALILNTQSNGKYHALIAGKNDNLKFDNFGQVYSIFEINPSQLEKEQIRISEFKQVFKAKAST
jgi:hypothetical protein